MHRSPFANFRKPHELLASASNMFSPHTRSPSHSRAKNRSSGGSSVGSHHGGNLLVDSSDENEGATGYSRSQSRGSLSKSRSRSASPSWDSRDPNSIPLLPIPDGESRVSSRIGSRINSPSPLDDDFGDEGVFADASSDWRIGEGSLGGKAGWFSDGKLGWWLWNTQRGSMVYIGLLVALYGGMSLALLVMNRFIMLTGVFKFGHPLTTTWLQLVFTQLFLAASASITRSFSRSLHALGLGSMVAPKPKPFKGKRRVAEGGGLLEFTNKLRPRTSGGVFELKWSEAQVVLPLAVIYSLKIVLSNLSFAFTQLQIYQLSRVCSLLLSLVFTYFFCRSQSLSVTTLSSCITMMLSLTMVSLAPGTRFAIEGLVAGIFSNIFVAAYPILLSRTYRAFLSGNPTTGDLLGDSGLRQSHDTQEETRAAWKLLHYTNFLSILIIFPWLIVSGEIRDISHNCYFLDVAFFWLMVLGAGAAAWGTFVAGFLLVRAATPLTMVVTTYPRSALQTVLLSGFRLPTWSWVGVLMCWGSSVWYALGRRKECGVSFFNTEEPETRGRRRADSLEAFSR